MLIVRYVVIQAASAVLTLLGVPLVAVLSATRFWHPMAPTGEYHWRGGALFWLWDNAEDGICAEWYASPIRPWHAFTWSAVRNPCNNLRFVRGVSEIGRPLWRHEWDAFGQHYYIQAGWNRLGYPVLSGGINIHWRRS